MNGVIFQTTAAPVCIQFYQKWHCWVAPGIAFGFDISWEWGHLYPTLVRTHYSIFYSHVLCFYWINLSVNVSPYKFYKFNIYFSVVSTRWNDKRSFGIQSKIGSTTNLWNLQIFTFSKYREAQGVFNGENH